MEETRPTELSDDEDRAVTAPPISMPSLSSELSSSTLAGAGARGGAEQEIAQLKRSLAKHVQEIVTLKQRCREHQQQRDQAPDTGVRAGVREDRTQVRVGDKLVGDKLILKRTMYYQVTDWARYLRRTRR